MGVDICFSKILKAVIEDRWILPVLFVVGRTLKLLEMLRWFLVRRRQSHPGYLFRCKEFVVVMEIQTPHDFPSHALNTTAIKTLNDLIFRKH